MEVKALLARAAEIARTSGCTRDTICAIDHAATVFDFSEPGSSSSAAGSAAVAAGSVETLVAALHAGRAFGTFMSVYAGGAERIPRCEFAAFNARFPALMNRYMYPLVHPAHMRAVGAALRTHGVVAALDCCAGNGFFSAVLQACVGAACVRVVAVDSFDPTSGYAMHKNRWFDVRPADGTALNIGAALFPEQKKAAAAAMRRTALVMAAPDGPDHPDVSLRALRNAARQGVGFVLTVGDEIGEYINEGAAAWLGTRAERVFHEATTVHDAA